MPSTVTRVNSLAPEQTVKWFSKIIAFLQSSYSDPICASLVEETGQMLGKLRLGDGNTDELFSQMHDISSAYFISKMLTVYLEELKFLKVKLNHLAFDYSHSKVMVWAEVADEDEDTMDNLILAEAKANGGSYDKNVCISTTLVEESDHISVPPHYIPFYFSKN